MSGSGSREALLVGATGLVGSHLLTLTLAVYSRVTVLTRRPTGQTHSRLREIVADLKSLPPINRVDDVYCALGTTIKKAGSQEAFRHIDHDIPLDLARRAVTAGARHYLLVSSVGADPRSGNFYLRVKGELEHGLGALPFQAVHFARPSFILGRRAEERTGEKFGVVLSRALTPLLVGALRKYRPVAAEIVARALVAAAQKTSPGIHTYHYDELLSLAEGVDEIAPQIR